MHFMSNLSLNHDIIQNLEEIFEYKVYVLDVVIPPMVILPTRALQKKRKYQRMHFLRIEQILCTVKIGRTIQQTKNSHASG